MRKLTSATVGDEIVRSFERETYKRNRSILPPILKYEDDVRYGFRTKYVNGIPISFQRYSDSEKAPKRHRPPLTRNFNSGDERDASNGREGLRGKSKSSSNWRDSGSRW